MDVVRIIYNLNALLPADIAIRAIMPVKDDAHCRFDAVGREYEYTIYQSKDPFMVDRAYFYPYKSDFKLLEEAADIIREYTDFTSFSKRNTQVKSFECKIQESYWERRGELQVYHVKGNRFLRGMVRGLTGTMLQVGRGKITLEGFRSIIEAKDCTKADFSVPGHGLTLVKVIYPKLYFHP